MKKIIIMVSLLSVLTATVFAQTVIGEFGVGLGNFKGFEDNQGAFIDKVEFTSMNTHLSAVSQFGATVSLGLLHAFSFGDDGNGAFSYIFPMVGVGYTYVHDFFTVGAEFIILYHGDNSDAFGGLRLSADVFLIGGFGVGAEFMYVGGFVDGGSGINVGIHMAVRL